MQPEFYLNKLLLISHFRQHAKKRVSEVKKSVVIVRPTYPYIVKSVMYVNINST
jgi:hypothetical protein